MKIKTSTMTKYTVVHLRDNDIDKGISMYSPDSFDTYEEAVKDWEENCRDRNKGNEYDKYWNAMPLVILQETTTRVILQG